jgi:hypothetical protein
MKINNFKKDFVIQGVLAVLALSIMAGYFIFTKKGSLEDSQQINSQTSYNQNIPVARSKAFIDAMQRELGTNYSVSISPRVIGFPGEASGPSVQKKLSGYVFTYSNDLSGINDYLGGVIGPAQAWLTTETSMGYANDSIICIQYDATYPPGSSRYDDNASPQNGPQIFCADNTQNQSYSTENWKTYTSTKYGYTIKYPNNWMVKSLDSEESLWFVDEEPESDKGSLGNLRIDVCENVNTDCARRGFAEGMRIYKDIPDLLNDKVALKTIDKTLPSITLNNNIKGYGVIAAGYSSNFEIMFDYNGKIYIIGFPTTYDGASLTAEQKEVISSFEFTPI